MSKTDIALQLTIKMIENGLITRIVTPDNSASDVNLHTANSVSQVYQSILDSLKISE